VMSGARQPKAMVDMAFEKTLDLTYRIKEANAFLRALKDERRAVAACSRP